VIFFLINFWGVTFQVRLYALAFFMKNKKELKQMLQSLTQAYLPTYSFREIFICF